MASSRETSAAAGVVGLAMGVESVDRSSVSWRDVAALAVRERCVALAWLRSRETILQHADADVAHWWRDLALRTLARGHAHVEVASQVARALGEAGVPCCVLKGTPLSVILYGEPGARASADLDIWVPLDARVRAREVLARRGWRHADGGLPYDEAFACPSAHGENYLEVHSRLLHSRLSYLPLPDPEVEPIAVAGALLPVMTGALLPAYLAVQIARHRFAPALWLIDLRTLWERLDDDGRALASWAARRCRTHRYLQWALRRAHRLDSVIQGDRSAARRVGLGTARRDFHPMWRELRLAPLPDGPFHALRGWIAPSWAAPQTLGALGVLRRVRRHWRSAVGTSRDAARSAGPGGVPAREITVGGEQLLRIARDVSMVGGRMWITSTGTSMYPTLLDRDRVLVEPATCVGLGDIVLVNDGGAPVLHRIVRMSGDRVTTRGDARMTYDRPLGRTDIIARAVRVRRGPEEWSLSPSAWRRFRMRIAAINGSSVDAGASRAPT